MSAVSKKVPISLSPSLDLHLVCFLDICLPISNIPKHDVQCKDKIDNPGGRRVVILLISTKVGKNE